MAVTPRFLRSGIATGILGRLAGGTGAAQPLSITELKLLMDQANRSGVGAPVGSTAFANPTAVAKDTAVNGTAVTAMRSDAAPAVQKASASVFGIVKVDGTSITESGGVISAGASGGPDGRFTTTPVNPGFDPFMIYNGSIVLSNSNKTATPSSGSPYNYAYGAPARFTGKRYFEVVPGSTSFENVGVCGSGGHIVDLDAGSPGNFGSFAGQVGWEPGGQIAAAFPGTGNIVTIATYNSWSSGDTLCIALDLDNLLIWFRVNGGNWNNSGTADPATSTGGLFVPMLLTNASNGLLWPGLNMGNTAATSLHLLTADLTQAVPAGFTAWAS